MVKKLHIVIASIISGLMFFCAALMFGMGARIEVSADEVSFQMIHGAVVRIVEPNGIMFQASVPSSYATDENKTFHMMIIPVDYITTYSLTTDYYTELVDAIGASKVVNLDCEPYQEGGNWFIRGAIVGIKYENLNRPFVGYGYYEEDGVNHYATFNDNYRSICNVASRYINSAEYDLASPTIKSYVENDILIKSYDSAIGNEEGTSDSLSDIGNALLKYDSAILLKNNNNVGLVDDYGYDINVEWVSDDTDVVNVNAEGVLTVEGSGSATVSGKIFGENKEVSVSVKEIDEDFKNVYIDPAFTDQNISYYSSYDGRPISYDLTDNAYLHDVDAYNTTTNLAKIDLGLIEEALKDGLTTISIDVKLKAGDGLLTSVNNLIWMAAGGLTYNSANITVTTESWVTISCNLLSVQHYTTPNTKAFIINGDGTVTINCSNFGITTKQAAGNHYQLLFKNLRAGEATSSVSGLYVKNVDENGVRYYEQDKVVFSGDNAIFTDGATITTYQYKYYQNGCYRLCDDATDILSLIDGVTVDLSGYSNTTYFSGYMGRVVSFDETNNCYLHNNPNALNKTINKMTISLDLIEDAIKAGKTTLSIDVKLLAGDGLQTSVGFKYATAGTVTAEGVGVGKMGTSNAVVVGTEEWVTMTVDLLNIPYNNANKAFVYDGEDVTFNCTSFGIITTKSDGSKYKLLFKNIRAS